MSPLPASQTLSHSLSPLSCSFLYFIDVYVCGGLCVGIFMCSAQGGQQRELETLELELYEVVSCLTWILGTELRSSCKSSVILLFFFLS